MPSRHTSRNKKPLDEYKAKRSFDKTAEPTPKQKHSETGRLFVIQKHRASHLHYDLRLEADGVLKSWAVPKGPSLDPKIKRLAMAVEDHPIDYATFEGIIPEGEYGGGTVMVWDYGTYAPDSSTKSVSKAIADGELKFTIHGSKLQGSWALVRTHDRNWLLIKHKDAFASEEDITETQATSVFTDRTLAEIAKDEGGNVDKAATGDPVKVSRRKTKKKESIKPASGRDSTARIEIPSDAKQAAMPKHVQPMLATLVDEPFTNDEWLFETKWDGVRTICYLNHGKHRLLSRRQNEVTAKYPEISYIGDVIEADQAILDGEIVALDSKGVPRFQLLQPRFGLKPERGKSRESEEAVIAYFIFDLLYLNGYDLTGVDLLHRKELLQKIIRQNDRIKFADHVIGEGEKFFKQIEKMRLEGMIAKRIDSTYIQKRSKDWLKIKTLQRTEAVIGGYTRSRGSREHFGALVMGLYDGNKLIYVGHTGGGFNRQTLKEVYDLMEPLKTEHSPFSTSVKTNETVQWIKPKLVCEIKFSEWTGDGHMRQPIFLGMRDDKDPKECVLEKKFDTAEVIEEKHDTNQSIDQPVRSNSKVIPASALLSEEFKGDQTFKAPGGTLKLSNLDKVYWPEDKYTKGDLLKYYYEIAPRILPYLKDRPLILKRYPNGIAETPFHQHTIQNPPDFVTTFVRENSEEENVIYAVANNVASLLYVANLGSISMHAWSARRTSPMNPDWVLFDLDPGTAEFGQVIEVALILQEQLKSIGLSAYAKTSGSKGLHVYVPIKNAYTHDQVVQFATLIAHITAEQHPDLIAVERIVNKRKKHRVYLDYLQNGFGKSLAAPYSVRARLHAPVSAPVTWQEIKRGNLRPDEFTIKNILKRISKIGDIFKPALTDKQSLSGALKKIEQLVRGGNKAA